MSFGLRESRFEFFEQGRSFRNRTGSTLFFKLASQLNNAFGAHIQAHALERMRLEGQLLRIAKTLPNLGKTLRDALQKKINQLAQHADAVIRRHLAEFRNHRRIEKLISRERLWSREKRGVGFSGASCAPAFERRLEIS